MKCGAKTRVGTPCQKDALRYATRCQLHGGRSPQSVQAAARRKAEDGAAKIAARQGIEPISDPLSELLKLAGEIKSVKDVLAEAARSDTPSAAAFERSLDRLHRILADVARLNIEERLARISEAQMTMYVETLLGTIQTIVEKLGHDADDPAVRAVVMDALRATQKALSAAPDLRQPAIGR